jgi:hypothetical protein
MTVPAKDRLLSARIPRNSAKVRRLSEQTAGASRDEKTTCEIHQAKIKPTFALRKKKKGTAILIGC